MAIHINLTVDQGTSFSAVAEIQNEDGTVFDLTGFTAFSQMRKSYYTKTAHDITATIEGDPVNGEIRLSLSPDITNGLRAGRYVYDVEVHNHDSTTVKRVLEGIVTVFPQVTKTL